MQTGNKAPTTTGFTLLEIMIVVAIVGLLAAVAVPNHVRARQESGRKACINNQRQIDAAVQQCAIENKYAGSDPVDGNLIAPYLKQGTDTACPSGGRDIFDSYKLTTFDGTVTCQKDATHKL